MAPKVLLAVAVVVLAAAATPASAIETGSSEVVVEAPRQVTAGTSPVRLFDIPALAVHPDDPTTVVMAVGDARNGGCGLWASRDGGLSWTNTATTLLPEGQPFCTQLALGPVMAPAFGSDGRLHVALPASSPATGHPRGPISLLVAGTDDLGATYETVTAAESQRVTVDPADFGGEGEPEEGNSWHKFPSLVVDPNDPDKLYLGWRWYMYRTDLQAPKGDIPFRPYLATSEDGGETWSDPIDLVDAAGGEAVYGASAPMLEVDDDGTIYGFSKELAQSPPPGEARQNPRVLMFKSTDGGQSWETSVVSEAGENLQASPESAIDPRTGDLYVVYGVGGAHASEGEPPPAPQEVFFTASTDQGATWSEPVVISSSTRPADKFFPAVDVASNGRIDVAWHDFRNDPFGPGQVGSFYRAERYWDVYATHSTDGGASWSSNLRVTPDVDRRERRGDFQQHRHSGADRVGLHRRSRLHRLVRCPGDGPPGRR